MEIISTRRTRAALVGILAAGALTGCDSYLTAPADVHCDGRRTQAELPADSVAAFIVHGQHEGEVATVDVRRNEAGVSVSVTGDITGPPQAFQADGFTVPIAVGASGRAALSAFGAGGAWVINVNTHEDTAAIQGSCS